MAIGPIGGLRPPGRARDRPDNTESVTGGEGEPMKQDEDGVQIHRLGIPGVDANWGPDTVEITDGAPRLANPDKVGGTRSCAGIVRSTVDEPCSVIFVWERFNLSTDTLAEAENNVEYVIERPPEFQNAVEHVIDAIETKADNVTIFCEDNSVAGTYNEVEYTLNFH